MVDQIDLELIEALKKDPDCPTSVLAERLNLTSKTILQRIATLSNNKIAKVCFQWDLHALGLDVTGHIYLNTGGTPTKEMVHTIASIRNVVAVAELVGSPDLYVTVVATDINEIYDSALAFSSLGPNVTVLDIEIMVATLKYSTDLSGMTSLEDAWPALEDTSPRVKLDEFDFAMMNFFIKDARTSNREVARCLSVSEATIRQRLKKLQSMGVIRKSVLVNPFIHDYTQAALIRLQVTSQDIDQFCTRLLQQVKPVVLMKVVGCYNLLLLVMGKNLSSISDQVRSHLLAEERRVQKYEILPILRSHKHSYTIVYRKEQSAS